MTEEKRKRGAPSKGKAKRVNVTRSFSPQFLDALESVTDDQSNFIEDYVWQHPKLVQWRKIAAYTELSRCISVGNYEEWDHTSEYPKGGVESSIDDLDQWAWDQGLKFFWHLEEKKWTLEPMSEEELAAYKAAQE